MRHRRYVVVASPRFNLSVKIAAYPSIMLPQRKAAVVRQSSRLVQKLAMQPAALAGVAITGP